MGKLSVTCVAFFWAGAVVAACGSLVAIAYRLPQPETDWVGISTLVGAALLNGIASASLTVLLQFFLAQFLGTTTALQLLEISRPDHPLLQRVLRNAPGTYQHSLQVANLAEQASERIGADALLTRVGALYHDVGKALNPAFYIENQMPGAPNPHDQLDPAASAEIIIQHVKDGLELARQHRIPRRIQDFIREHHGTMIARYQYVNAVKAAGGDESKVDSEPFRYPGPSPRSRETAILMLADGSEARVRAERPAPVHPASSQLPPTLRALLQGVLSHRIGRLPAPYEGLPPPLPGLLLTRRPVRLHPGRHRLASAFAQLLVLLLECRHPRFERLHLGEEDTHQLQQFFY